MYFVRSLRNVCIDSKIICMFYNSVVSSVLSYAITSWYKSCTDKQIKDIYKFGKRVKKMTSKNTHQLIEDINDRYEKQCIALVEKIMDNSYHPLHSYFCTLPHNRLNMIYCRTTRFKNTFVPSAIKLYNM